MTENGYTPTEGDVTSNSTEKQLESRINEELDELTHRNWVPKLEEVDFQGDKEQGQVIMHSIAEGTNDVIKALHKRGHVPDDYNVPDIVLSHDAVGAQTKVKKWVDESGQSYQTADIHVSPKTVRIYSEIQSTKPDKVGSTKADTGEVSMSGRITDIAYLMGVEEGAHTVFVAKKGNPTESDYTREKGSDQAAYDAQDVEYHGLGWRIRAVMDAKEEGKIPEDVADQALAPLQERMQKAIEIRQKLKTEINEEPQPATS